MAISFNQVPANLRINFFAVEFSSENAVQGSSPMPYRNLIIGQKTAVGSADGLIPVQVTSADTAKTLFGSGSMLAQMVACQLENNASTETWALPFDDPDSAAVASGKVTVAGTANSAGTLYLYIAGRQVAVGVQGEDAADAIAASMAAAVNEDVDLPVTANAAGADVVLSAKNKGELGNGIDLRINYYGESLPDGVEITITAMNGGSGAPDLDQIWSAVGDEQYHVITCPYNDASNLTKLEGELEDRWSAMRMIEGVAVSACTSQYSAVAALGDSRNSKHLAIVEVCKSPTPCWEIAAAAAGVVSYHGSTDPARPFQTLALSGVLPPLVGDRLTNQERNLLLYDGIATTTVDAGGVVRLERVITTYKQSPSGAPDTAYLDLNTVLTLGYLRYDFRNYIRRKYPRHKIADDGTRFGAGQAVITPKTGKAEALVKFRDWEELGLVEGFEQFKSDLICERNPSDPTRLDWYLPPNLVNQFRVAGAKVAFIL